MEKILDKKHAMYQFLKNYSVKGTTRYLNKYFSIGRSNQEDLDTTEFNFYKLAQSKKFIDIIRQLLNFIWLFRGSKNWWILYREISTLLLSLLSCRRGIALLAYNPESVSDMIQLLMKGENQNTFLSRDCLPLSACNGKYLFPPCSPIHLANLLAFHVHALLAVDELLETDSGKNNKVYLHLNRSTSNNFIKNVIFEYWKRSNHSCTCFRRWNERSIEKI